MEGRGMEGGGNLPMGVEFMSAISPLPLINPSGHNIAHRLTRSKKKSDVYVMYPKLQLTLFSILVFLVVSSFRLYDLTDTFIAKPLGLEFQDKDGYPTNVGMIVHALVAGLLTNLYLMTFKF